MISLGGKILGNHPGLICYSLVTRTLPFYLVSLPCLASIPKVTLRSKMSAGTLAIISTFWQPRKRVLPGNGTNFCLYPTGKNLTKLSLSSYKGMPGKTVFILVGHIYIAKNKNLLLWFKCAIDIGGTIHSLSFTIKWKFLWKEKLSGKN